MKIAELSLVKSAKGGLETLCARSAGVGLAAQLAWAPCVAAATSWLQREGGGDGTDCGREGERCDGENVATRF